MRDCSHWESLGPDLWPLVFSHVTNEKTLQSCKNLVNTGSVNVATKKSVNYYAKTFMDDLHISHVMYIEECGFPYPLDYRAKLLYWCKLVHAASNDIHHVPYTMINNYYSMLFMVRKNGLALKLAGKNIVNDRDLVMAAVQQNGEALQFASDAMKNDEKVVMEAVQQNGEAFRFASDELRDRTGA